ncbi:hypothetical protein LIA77_03035 [Sarocladium implicatum]|nr:hypothetical protein LIA77_03035 [Sarocladium implicatum]
MSPDLSQNPPFDSTGHRIIIQAAEDHRSAGLGKWCLEQLKDRGREACHMHELQPGFQTSTANAAAGDVELANHETMGEKPRSEAPRSEGLEVLVPTVHDDARDSSDIVFVHDLGGHPTRSEQIRGSLQDVAKSSWGLNTINIFMPP